MTDINNTQTSAPIPLDFTAIESTMRELEISINQDTAQIADLQSLRISVERLGGIDRQLASTMEMAAPGVLNTDCYPLNSYTQIPSRTNYTHALESADTTGRSIGQRIWDAIVNALKTVWRVFKHILDSVFVNAEDSSLKRVVKLQKHIKDILNGLPSIDQHAAKEKMRSILADPVSVIGTIEYDRINTKLGLDFADKGRLYTAATMLFDSFAGLLSELVELVNRIPKMNDVECAKILDKPSMLQSKGIVAIMYSAGIHTQSAHIESAAAALLDFKNQIHTAKDALVGTDIVHKLYQEHSLLFNPLLKDARGLMNDASELTKTISKLDEHSKVMGAELPAKRDLIKRTFKEITAVMDISSIYYFTKNYQRAALNAYIRILKAQIKAITPKGASRE